MKLFSTDLLPSSVPSLLHASVVAAGWIFNLLDRFDLPNHSLSSLSSSAVTALSSGCGLFSLLFSSIVLVFPTLVCRLFSLFSSSGRFFQLHVQQLTL